MDANESTKQSALEEFDEFDIHRLALGMIQQETIEKV